jgi:hypothetical protein
MSRDYIINGETLVKVKLGAQYPSVISPGIASGNIFELGLAIDKINISPVFYQRNIYVDDFGPNVPAEIACQIAEVNISMTLVHYDKRILDWCMAESMGGVVVKRVFGGPEFEFAGTLAGAGVLLGNNLPLQASGGHFISLNLTSPQLSFPWRFPASFLTTTPLVIPLGTEKTMAVCQWKAIPYAPVERPSLSGVMSGQELVSSGITLWDHSLDGTEVVLG